MVRATLLSCENEHYLIAVIPKRSEAPTLRPPFTSSATTPHEAVVLTLRPDYTWGFNGTPRVDVFDSMDKAVGAVQSRSVGKDYTMLSFRCFLGAVVLDHMYLLVSDVAEATMMLPNKCSVYELRTWRWVPISTNVPSPHLRKKEREHLSNFLDTTFHTGYFFCDEVNLSSPFPYLDTTGRDWLSCNWLHAMHESFEKIGLGQVCTRLHRGFAMSKTITIQTATGFSLPAEIALLGRQSYHNPGPRFFGRGLNDAGAAGNDLVYELLLYYEDKGSLRYARHTFLRGTVPLHFTSTMHGAVGEAIIELKPEPFQHTQTYFTRCLRKLSALTQADLHPEDLEAAAALLPDCGGDGGMSPRSSSHTQPYPSLRCVNLLRTVSPAGEDVLSEAYAREITALTMFHCATARFIAKCKLDLVQLDWLAAVKDDGVEGAVDKLWNIVLPWYGGASDAPASQTDVWSQKLAAFYQKYNPGEMQKVEAIIKGGKAHTEILPALFTKYSLTPDDQKYWNEWQPPASSKSSEQCVTCGTYDLTSRSHTIEKAQRNFIRFNCADSLDRTNLAGFFCGLQVAVQMTLALRVRIVSPVEAKVDEKFTMSRMMKDLLPSSPLSRKATTASFSEPIISSLDAYLPNYDAIKATYPPALLAALVAIFVANGDTIATLYTSSPALSTDMMRKFVPGMATAQPNAVISSQRRFQNVFEDKKRMIAAEVIMGINLPSHFPSLYGAYILPLPPSLWCCAAFLRPVPPGVDDRDICEAIATIVKCSDSVDRVLIAVGANNEALAPEQEVNATLRSPTNRSISGSQNRFSPPPDIGLGQEDSLSATMKEIKFMDTPAADNTFRVGVVLFKQQQHAKLLISAQSMRLADVEVPIRPYEYTVEPRKTAVVEMTKTVMGAFDSMAGMLKM